MREEDPCFLWILFVVLQLLNKSGEFNYHSKYRIPILLMAACPFAFRYWNRAALGSHSPFVFTDLLFISHPEADLFHCHWPTTTCSRSKREIWKPTEPAKDVTPNRRLFTDRVAPGSFSRKETRTSPKEAWGQHHPDPWLLHSTHGTVVCTGQRDTMALHSWERTLAEAEDCWGKPPPPPSYFLGTAYLPLFFLRSCLFLSPPLSLLGLSNLFQAFLLPPDCLKQQVSSSAHRPQIFSS